jgi:crotonobetainyl-CoA:carnitine CoA-transferase CaiB-like acyl-CoA transferase
VDLTWHVAGPYCTRLLAGFGARVIKIERRGIGDPLRSAGPFAEGRPGLERSLPFLWLNAGKQSVTLDLKRPEGREALLGLAGRADVVVEGFRPGVMERLGLGAEALRRASPSAVVTSISSFGSTGPYRDYRATEAVLYALSGGMAATGDPDRPPLASGPAIVQYTAGAHAYLGTLLALYRRRAGAGGERVEVSAQESALDNVEIALAEQLRLGHGARRTGDAHAMVPWQAYPCRDGYAAVIGGPLRRWPEAARLFGDAGLLDEPFRGMAGRMKHRAEFERRLRASLMRRGKEEVYRAGQARGVAFGYVATVPEAGASPQHRARGFFAPAEPHPEVGAQTHCGPPFALGPGSWRRGRAPLLGEHTAAVLEEIGYTPEGVARLARDGVV